MSATTAPDTILFDGVCNLCNSFVQFVIRHDPEGRFRFAALQSDAAHALLAAQGIAPATLAADPESVVLLSGGRLYSHSTAVLRIARSLGGVWRLATVGWVLPRAWRDGLYRIGCASSFARMSDQRLERALNRYRCLQVC